MTYLGLVCVVQSNSRRLASTFFLPEESIRVVQIISMTLFMKAHYDFATNFHYNVVKQCQMPLTCPIHQHHRLQRQGAQSKTYPDVRQVELRSECSWLHITPINYRDQVLRYICTG